MIEKQVRGIKRIFIETTIFTKRWVEFDLNDNNLSELEEFIMKNPDFGDTIQGTGGLIKLRWNLPNKGKRGGLRVLYVDFIKQEKVVLVNCYIKREKGNISENEKTMYKKLINEIREELL